MTRVRLILLVLAILALAGMLVPLITRGRVNSDRVSCENHLRQLGLLGVRHASAPGQGLPARMLDQLPPGTFERTEFKARRVIDERALFHETVDA